MGKSSGKKIAGEAIAVSFFALVAASFSTITGTLSAAPAVVVATVAGIVALTMGYYAMLYSGKWKLDGTLLMNLGVLAVALSFAIIGVNGLVKIVMPGFDLFSAFAAMLAGAGVVLVWLDAALERVL